MAKLISLENLERFKDKCDAEYQTKEIGKGLSSNDFTTEEKNKISDIDNKVSKTDYANTNNAGVIKTPIYGGLYTGPDGNATVNKATEAEINSKSDNYKPIVSSKLNYAVKKALTDAESVNNPAQWTDRERNLARTTLGISEELNKKQDKLIAGSNIHIEQNGTISAELSQPSTNTIFAMYFNPGSDALVSSEPTVQSSSGITFSTSEQYIDYSYTIPTDNFAVSPNSLYNLILVLRGLSTVAGKKYIFRAEWRYGDLIISNSSSITLEATASIDLVGIPMPTNFLTERLVLNSGNLLTLRIYYKTNIGDGHVEIMCGTGTQSAFIRNGSDVTANNVFDNFNDETHSQAYINHYLKNNKADVVITGTVEPNEYGVYGKIGQYYIQHIPTDAFGRDDVLYVCTYSNDSIDIHNWTRLANKQPDYELIETITLTKDTQRIDRTTKPNGNGYNFKKLFVFCETQPVSSNAYLSCRFIQNGNTIFAPYIYSLKTSVRYSYFSLEIEQKMATMQAAQASNYNGTYLSIDGNGKRIVDGDYIDGVSIYGTNAETVIPSGSVIKIYGVE